jgi:midasin
VLAQITHIFKHHAASITFLDGLHSIPQLSTYSQEALQRLRSDALSKLQEITPLPNGLLSFVPYHDPSTSTQWGAFAIPKGPLKPLVQSINWDVPTTRENITRLIRACQLHKPILLEGSPGVGKTSLITALASIAGYPLCRINLSDQTDLVDLFGSDLPVEGGGAGEFAWRDAEFLKAMQDGYWVLLDEMNLAPQAVLEGLNAVLDHRGTVYIPELGRSFTRHPDFRVFATQNPLHQGGGRKGLPKSFVNRFTKVYVEELSSNDLFSVCRNLFSSYDDDLLRGMIAYNTLLTEEVSVKRTLGREGAPWEFNLRDVIRWGTLLTASPCPVHPHEFVDSVYVNRFRNATDRYISRQLFKATFPDRNYDAPLTPRLTISPTHLQIRHFHIQRENHVPSMRTPQFLQSQLSSLETIGLCVSQSWLVIVTGTTGCGKTSLIRSLAHFTGNVLHEISVNGATDAMDILGSFEQVDDFSRTLAVVKDVIALVDRQLRTVRGSRHVPSTTHNLRKMSMDPSISSSHLLKVASELLDETNSLDEEAIAEQVQCRRRIQDLLMQIPSVGRFEWIDGPLVTAIKKGSWVLLDGANLCNPSVLDRLNSLCEVGGILALGERGFVSGKVQVLTPSPTFRLFMTVDPQFGELSRAMRNRGIETSLTCGYTTNDYCRMRNHLRLPIITETDICSPLMFEAIRRGLQSPKATAATEPFSTVPPFLQDSSLSSFMFFSPLLSLALETTSDIETSALHVLSRVIPPTEWALVRRFITKYSGVKTGYVAKFFRLLEEDRPLEGAIRAYSQSRGLSHGLVCVRVSPCRWMSTCSTDHFR